MEVFWTFLKKCDWLIITSLKKCLDVKKIGTKYERAIHLGQLWRNMVWCIEYAPSLRCSKFSLPHPRGDWWIITSLKKWLVHYNVTEHSYSLHTRWVIRIRMCSYPVVLLNRIIVIIYIRFPPIRREFMHLVEIYFGFQTFLNFSTNTFIFDADGTSYQPHTRGWWSLWWAIGEFYICPKLWQYTFLFLYET